APRRLPDRPRKVSAWSGDLIFTLTQKNCGQKDFYLQGFLSFVVTFQDDTRNGPWSLAFS
ncbi:hypothetical protein, partial [Peribacillus frigoritolerans]|uniref:hypothetical protein n=1 Tax=Peribacillus frigoritolerans TaxID=450367 RepID=UPI002E22AFFE|nr:hypothetical protein [Peribacillus frigoritolerans]